MRWAAPRVDSGFHLRSHEFGNRLFESLDSAASTARAILHARPPGDTMQDASTEVVMSTNELEMFLASWDREAGSTVKLLKALPPAQYDFRPDSGGRSLGELAWHLAEGDAYMSYG